MSPIFAEFQEPNPVGQLQTEEAWVLLFAEICLCSQGHFCKWETQAGAPRGSILCTPGISSQPTQMALESANSCWVPTVCHQIDYCHKKVTKTFTTFCCGHNLGVCGITRGVDICLLWLCTAIKKMLVAQRQPSFVAYIILAF